MVHAAVVLPRAGAITLPTARMDKIATHPLSGACGALVGYLGPGVLAHLYDSVARPLTLAERGLVGRSMAGLAGGVVEERAGWLSSLLVKGIVGGAGRC